MKILKDNILSLVLSGALTLFLTQASAQVAVNGNIQVGNTFIRGTVSGQTATGGFLVITNSGSVSDKLIGVSSSTMGELEIHEMKMEGNRMLMREISALEIPAKSKVELKPGGYHLMITGLKKPLQEGEILPIRLKFEKAGELTVDFPVKSLSTMKMH
ncbi:MAG: copper chaperone PCu(A)C [Betaproteobacteria bacterium]|jgi:copper(I)-binding protein